MKKLSLTVKTLLSVALVAATAACSGKTETAATAPAATESDAPAAASIINIRYIDADSVMSAYKLAQQLLEEQ